MIIQVTKPSEMEKFSNKTIAPYIRTAVEWWSTDGTIAGTNWEGVVKSIRHDFEISFAPKKGKYPKPKSK